MKTLKIVGLVLLLLVLMVGGLVFAASFAVDQLQSWPKALFEARVVVYGQIVLGFSFGLATGKSRSWLAFIVLLTMLVSVVGFGWALGATPPSRFGLCFWGILLYMVQGGVILAELVRETLPRSHPLPPATQDPSLN